MGLWLAQEGLRTYFVQVSVLALNGSGDVTETSLRRHRSRVDLTRLLIRGLKAADNSLNAHLLDLPIHRNILKVRLCV